MEWFELFFLNICSVAPEPHQKCLSRWGKVIKVNFHIRTVHLDIMKVLFIQGTDALVMRLKNNIRIYIKIYIKTAPTCFGVTVTPSSGGALICA